MKIHLLDENCSKNLCVPSEEMKNISKCGKEVKEYSITIYKHEVTCRNCLKIINEEN